MSIYVERVWGLFSTSGLEIFFSTHCSLNWSFLLISSYYSPPTVYWRKMSVSLSTPAQQRNEKITASDMKQSKWLGHSWANSLCVQPLIRYPFMEENKAYAQPNVPNSWCSFEWVMRMMMGRKTKPPVMVPGTKKSMLRGKLQEQALVNKENLAEVRL